jgi:hypothetical protein
LDRPGRRHAHWVQRLRQLDLELHVHQGPPPVTAQTPEPSAADDGTDQFVAELLGPPLADAAARIAELLLEAAETDPDANPEG